MGKADSLERLNEQLEKSVRLLDECSLLISDRVAEALGNIFEIQIQIYQQRPDLMHDRFKKGWGKAREESDQEAGH